MKFIFKKPLVILSAIVLVSVFSWCSHNKSKTSETNTSNQVEENKTMANANYLEYSAEKIANSSWDIVLFFHAPWCPSCKSADKNISNEITPEWLTIFKVDYDSSNDLKKKYWVTWQHTFVQINKSWEMIKKWSGSRKVSDILEKVE